MSPEAKVLGISRGMPIFRIRRDFPQAVVVSGDYPSYVRYSGMMMDIVRRYADDMEEYSIDECFADLEGLDRTYIGGVKMTYREMAERIQKEIWEELDITVSVGVAPTKCLAKVASKWFKPRGLTMIDHATAENFLSTVPIEKVWGIGKETSLYLKKQGIKTARDFTEKGIAWVEEHLSKPYGVIWHELRGTSIMKVDPRPKELFSSIQKTGTFRPPTSDRKFLCAELSRHIENACAKARRYGLVPREASIFLKTQDFLYVSAPLPLALPTNAPELIMKSAQSVLDHIYDRHTIYRATGVRLYGLVPAEFLPTDLFGAGQQAQKFEEIHKEIDKLEAKHGKRLVRLGSSPGTTEATAEDDEERGGNRKENIESNLLFL